MSVMILDAGNSIIKAKIARREMGEVAFPHALQPLTENEYTTILARAGKTTPLRDYLRVNGKPYVIGESAERHGLVTQRNGAARYTRDYYGVLAAASLGWLYERGGEIKLFGSHPPGRLAGSRSRPGLLRPPPTNAYGYPEQRIGKDLIYFPLSCYTFLGFVVGAWIFGHGVAHTDSGS